MMRPLMVMVVLPAACAKRALLVVDVQDCFLDASCTDSGTDGSLAVPACGIVPKIKDLINDKSCMFDEVIYSQDYHPAGHISYASSHGIDNWIDVYGKSVPMKCLKPSNTTEVDAACCPTLYVNESLVNCSDGGVVCPPANWTYAVQGADLITDNVACTVCRTDPSSCFDATQALWSDHCLDTGDSQINAGVAPRVGDLVVKKGQNKFVDAYSAFMDNTKNIQTQLDSQLQAKGITELFVVGIATDVCVKATVLDAFHVDTAAYNVTVISDATAAVQGNADNHAAAVTAMETAGATIKTVADVLAMDHPSCPILATANDTIISNNNETNSTMNTTNDTTTSNHTGTNSTTNGTDDNVTGTNSTPNGTDDRHHDSDDNITGTWPKSSGTPETNVSMVDEAVVSAFPLAAVILACIIS